MPRTEFGVAVASILIVAGVLAIPLAVPAATATPATIHQPIIRPTSSATPSASDLVGSGCAAYEAAVPTGSGSIVGMSSDLVTQAASNNPQLTKLTAAVSGKLNPSVNLVSTLDNGEYTVFAPVDSAFAKLPAATLAALAEKSNASKLTGILEYHVVKGEFAPDKVDGMLPNLEGGTLTVAGSGNSITVNGANVICGGIQTSNAVVYLIDTVLTPPATN